MAELKNYKTGKKRRGRPAGSISETRLVQVRLPVKIADKLNWFAQSEGLTAAETARNLITAQVRDVKRPYSTETREIGATNEQWREWHDLAEKFGVGIDELVAKIMDQVCRKHLSGGDER